MRRTLLLPLTTTLFVFAGWTSRAEAQKPEGFAVERLYLSSPGGGWLVMDDLDIHGRFGFAIAVSTGYARKPLTIASAGGPKELNLVSDQAFADVSVAATYHRFRLSLSLPMPLIVTGESGMLGAYQFTAPSLDPGRNPDTISDARVGFEVRLLGAPGSLFRAGAGAQLIIPFGDRTDYITDGTFRGMFRALVAGDLGRFTYAGQLGVHIRPLDDSPAPGSPRGSELLFGVAAGRRLLLDRSWSVVLGPEIFGETAFRSFFREATTGLEALLTGRFERAAAGRQLRVKVGAGGGLDPHFGAPQWRVVLAVEFLELFEE